MLTPQNWGIRWGAITDPNGQNAWRANSDALALGWQPRWTMETLDKGGGQTLIWNQIRAYQDVANRNKRWVHRVAEQLPAGEKFNIVLTLPCVPKSAQDAAALAGMSPLGWMMTTDPANTADNVGRYQIRRQLDLAQSIQNAPGSRIKFEIRPMHENNLAGLGGWGKADGTDAEFVALFRWVSDEVRARGMTVSWCLSIGPIYRERLANPPAPGLNFDHSHGLARFPGAAYVDVFDLDFYNKRDADRDRTTLRRLLEDWFTLATNYGLPVGFSEWASGAPTGVCSASIPAPQCPPLGAPPDHGWLLDTLKLMEAAPPTGPGSVAYAVWFGPRFGANVDENPDGGGIDGYYDLIRFGATVFPERHQMMEDTALWLEGGRSGPPPFDPGAPPGPILGEVDTQAFAELDAIGVVEHRFNSAALAVVATASATPSPPEGIIEMTALTNAGENLVLNWLLTAGAVTRPSTWHVQLHTGAPGEDGTANVATNSTRQAVTFASASGGSISNSGAVSWTSVPASETYAAITVWSASSGGTALLYGNLTQSRAVTSGDTFTIPVGSLTVTAD